MRFKVDQPKEEETRILKKFAWLPVYIDDCKVWFEFYEIMQIYKKVDEVLLLEQPLPNPPKPLGIFKILKWVSVSKRLIN